MHRRIPWTELFSYITSEASSLTLSEVENIFAAWRLVLKKMYLSRRIICFSGIEVVWSTHTLKRPRRFFSVPVALPKTKMVRQISVIQNLIWYSTIVEHHGKMLILSLLSISWGCDVHSAFFLDRFAVVLLARAGRTWSAWSHKSLVDWMCGRTLPMATYVFSNLSDLSWPIEDGLGPFQYISKSRVHLSILSGKCTSQL